MVFAPSSRRIATPTIKIAEHKVLPIDQHVTTEAVGSTAVHVRKQVESDTVDLVGGGLGKIDLPHASELDPADLAQDILRDRYAISSHVQSFTLSF